MPVVLHDDQHDPLAEVDRALDGFVAAGAGVLVLAAATGHDGYDERPALDEVAWKRLFDNLDRLVEHAAERGCAGLPAPARRHDRGVPTTTYAACSTARLSRCAWTPVTC